MRKYWVIFKVNWQKSFEYRGEFLARLLRGLIALAVMLFIFRAVFKQTENFSGYNFSSIFTYLIMVRVLHFSFRGNTARLVAREIKEGALSSYLIKPVSYLKYWFSSFLADRSFEMPIDFSLIFLFLFLFPAYFSFPSLSRLFSFLLFVMLSLFLNYFINLIMAFFTFWVTDIRLFNITLGLAIDFLAGNLIPLDMLPGLLKKISLFLPFQYALYFPIKIYQGALSTKEIIQGLFFCLIWLGISFCLFLALWRKGLKRYEAIGQ